MDFEELYSKMEEAPKALTDLMQNLKLNNKKAFKQVLRGFPDKDINTYGGDIGVCSLKKIHYTLDFDNKRRPYSLDLVLGIICKGTKTKVHDKVTKLTLDVSKKLEKDRDWFTLKGNVKTTTIEDHEIYIEQTKRGMLTSSVFELNCPLNRFHEDNSLNVEKLSIRGKDLRYLNKKVKKDDKK